MEQKSYMVMNPNKKYALVGTRIQHSLSPELWQAAYGGLQGTYELIDTDNLGELLDARNNYDGINITMPFKADAAKMCHYMDYHVHWSGVANCLKNISNERNENGTELEGTLVQDRTIVAANTDCFAIDVICDICSCGYDSVMASLAGHKRIHDFVPKYQKTLANSKQKPIAVVIGCGGAGKAAAVALCKNGYEVVVHNRTSNEASRFVNMVKDIKPSWDITWTSGYPVWEPFDKAELIVYAIPCANDDVIETITGIEHKPKVVIEANYANPVLKDALKPYDVYVSGYIWLWAQACAGFEFLTGVKPNIQKMYETIQKYL